MSLSADTSFPEGLESYGVPDGAIHGIRYGLRGFYETDHPPAVLNNAAAETIHLLGGTVLGTSRGGADIPRIVDAIISAGYNMVFGIGGNGGNAAVVALDAECQRRGYPCAFAGLPKSIDNDLLLVDRTFGFETACEEASAAIAAAAVEARSARHGIGLVKLMGRQAGFICASSAIASGEVDVAIIPEAEVSLDRLLSFVHARVKERGHATVVVAEGAFQCEMRAELAASGRPVPDARDPSGNPVLLDVGVWLKDRLKDYFCAQNSGMKPDTKLISPSYSAFPARAWLSSSVFC